MKSHSRFSKIWRLGISASCILGGALGSVGCSSAVEEAPVEGTQPLKGGNVTNAFGVVQFTLANNGGCTGTMIAPNAILTAAHCFNSLNTPSPGIFWVRIEYFDPVRGKRPVFENQATFTKHPAYNGTPANDTALITIPGVFTDTDYHDYKRILDITATTLPSSLRFYGAGAFGPNSPGDGNLRTHALTVESYTSDQVVTDNGDGIAVCHGDSGGPLIQVASTPGYPNSLELVVGVLAQMNVIGDDDLCASESWWLADNAKFDRTGRAGYRPWIWSVIGHPCVAELYNATRPYLRCFDLPFIEDVTYEGMTQGQETAILSTIQDL
jgi:hypothetical protein